MTDHDQFARPDRTAQEWLVAVADGLGTEDRSISYRILRAWLHTVRDRIGVDAAAHFAAQLPTLLRGLFFEGWKPSQVPVRLDADQFLVAMAREAGIAPADARHAAAVVTVALRQRCSPGQLDHLLAQLPGPLRNVLAPPDREPAAGGPAARDDPSGDADRIERLERDVGVVADALRALLHGIEEHPSEVPRPDRIPAAAHRAHQILLTLGQR
jgi:uncharacterized protein (DUF2267 family)